MDIVTIMDKLNIKYYQSIKYNLTKNNIEYEWLNQHINKLMKKIDNDKITETATEKKQEKTVSSESENHKQIFNDDSLYKKPWSKLNSIHKILKIKEFVNNLKINSEKDRNLLKDELIGLIKTKVLTKKDKVKYDETNGKIVSLTNLQYKEGKYFYLVE